MSSTQFVDIYGESYHICSSNNIVLEDFEFAMRDYITTSSVYNNICNLDICTIFEHEIFKKRYLVMTGCAYLYKGSVTVFLAPHYSGKTSLVYEAVRCGAQLITDDLVVIDRINGQILPLRKPICFRKELLLRSGLTREYLQQKMIQHRYFVDGYGPRLLLHAFDYLEGKYCETHLRIDELYVQDVQSNPLYSIIAHVRGFNFIDVPVVLSLISNTKCHLVNNICNQILQHKTIF